MKIRKLFAVILTSFIGSSIAMAGGNSDIITYQKKDTFADTRQDLIDAIIGRGYVIDFNGRVGDMLKRTQADVGGKPLYKDAEYMAFCSAVLSSNMMKAERQNIALCPYIMTVYENDGNPGTIFVSYRKLTSSSQTDQSLIAVENMLDEVAREAVE